jgi:hypothetical protein
MCGKEWKQFIRDKRLHGEEMIHFNLSAEEPRITILYIKGDDDEEEEEDEEGDVETAKDDALAGTLFFMWLF